MAMLKLFAGKRRSPVSIALFFSATHSYSQSTAITPAGGCLRWLPRFVGYVSEFVVVALIFGNVFGIGTEHATGSLFAARGL
jgi:hypothetical protein